MNDYFPALSALERAAKQSKPLSVEQRLQLAEICLRLQELTVAASNSAGAIGPILAATPGLRGEARALRRLRLALSSMVRPLI